MVLTGQLGLNWALGTDKWALGTMVLDGHCGSDTGDTVSVSSFISRESFQIGGDLLTVFLTGATIIVV